MTDLSDADIQAIADGSRAEAALDYLAPIFEALRSKASELMMASGIDQTALREKLFLSIRAINHAEGAIRSVLDQAAAARIMGEHPNMQVMALNALAAEGLTRP